ncbi:zinc finger, CCHC-type, Retrotransposon gag domain protein [Artemisia annua]|uniref:Zinc finger, CCHC-type, Retrotransposon gag domain protein n=1 Tax=Artemisia annua TaxID=35608 RepID=A0A2U1NLA7_ARTAN|nr:zinc finger, CCHC-type, Retrotransposon gag domain protein [Artemisia annua]
MRQSNATKHWRPALTAIAEDGVAREVSRQRESGAGFRSEKRPLIKSKLARKTRSDSYGSDYWDSTPQMALPVFSPTPFEAEDWITHMEKNFEVLGSGDEFKARLATFKLEGDALNWWKAHKQAKGGDVYMTTCTWAEFCGTFYKRYFPDSEHQRFKQEYNTIRQREDLNSGEYMQRFLRLASFVGPIAGDASRQAKHFKWGLKKWVLDRLLYTEFVDVSLICQL